MSKRFKLAAKDIQPLVKGLGGCIATDRITVDGAPVSVMARDPSDRPGDSGWLFLAGDESQEYMDDPNNLAVYDVNTIANYDSAIIPYLYAMPGQVFERVPGTDDFEEAADSDPQPDPDMPIGVDVVTGSVEIGEGWSIEVPSPYRRRREDGDLVLWRAGLTIWISPPQTSKGDISERVAEVRAGITPIALDIREAETEGGLRYVSYRVKEDSAGPPSLNTIVFARHASRRLAIYFDRANDEPTARGLIDSVLCFDATSAS